jgi:hypothetical protein
MDKIKRLIKQLNTINLSLVIGFACGLFVRSFLGIWFIFALVLLVFANTLLVNGVWNFQKLFE